MTFKNLIYNTVKGLKDGLVGTLNIANNTMKAVSTGTEYTNKGLETLATGAEENAKNTKTIRFNDYLKGLAKKISTATGEKISAEDLTRYVAQETIYKAYDKFLEKLKQTEDQTNKVDETLGRYFHARSFSN